MCLQRCAKADTWASHCQEELSGGSVASANINAFTCINLLLQPVNIVISKTTIRTDLKKKHS